ncbi:hypothetical protein P4S95_27105 [Aneurinibacillus aneurinilyticus]|uniref:hypothetical protein n=1 Tax=Aneurinibacillus aneurinilyticus TaxID=1391 RepID=UPI002E1C192C|nr:hypothetical protein [Aneurinibacillus aneurinilyticus]
MHSANKEGIESIGSVQVGLEYNDVVKAPGPFLSDGKGMVDEVEVNRLIRRMPPGSGPLPQGCSTKRQGNLSDKGTVRSDIHGLNNKNPGMCIR